MIDNKDSIKRNCDESIKVIKKHAEEIKDFHTKYQILDGVWDIELCVNKLNKHYENNEELENFEDENERLELENYDLQEENVKLEKQLELMKKENAGLKEELKESKKIYLSDY